MDKEFDYLVVGSGVTGMTISLLLADCGFRVLLLEKSGVIGGSMQRFYRCGIPFDTGFHFTAALSGCMGDMVRMLKFSPPLETIPIRTNLYLADRKKLFHLPRGRSRVRDYFCSLFPEEAEKIRRQAKKHCLPSIPVICNATGLRLCLAPTTARPTTGCVACGAAKNKNHLTFLVA